MTRLLAVLLAVCFAMANTSMAEYSTPVPIPRPNPQPDQSASNAMEAPENRAGAGDKKGTSAEALPVPVARPQPDKTAKPNNPESAAGTDAPVGKQSVKKPPAPPKQLKPVFVLDDAKSCERELRSLKAKFTVAGALEGEGQCGWPRPVALTALGPDIDVGGSIKVRCEVALALARWSKEVVVPAAKLHLGKKPVSVDISTSYQCRRRNNARTGKLSEHAFANGVDVMGVRFKADQAIKVVERTGSSSPERAFQAAVRGGACAYFTTVIGPTTNASHSDHFHLDLAVRRGGYRLCQ